MKEKTTHFISTREISNIVDDFYSLNPKYRTKKRLKKMLITPPKYMMSVNLSDWGFVYGSAIKKKEKI